MPGKSPSRKGRRKKKKKGKKGNLIEEGFRLGLKVERGPTSELFIKGKGDILGKRGKKKRGKRVIGGG